MRITAKHSKLTPTREFTLWENIFNYWSGINYHKDTKFKDNLNEAAKKRVDIVVKKLDDIFRNEMVQDLVHDYSEVLEYIFEKVRISETIQVTIDHLAFHYIHMMNNRLGVTPIEEAYLGALLLNSGNIYAE